MEELFLNKEHIAKFSYMMNELGFEDLQDPYWRSLVFIISGNDKLFDERNALVNFKGKEINSETWFDGSLSGGEQRLLALAYNLFTNQDFYKFENGKKYYISPLDIFSGIDETGYTLAKNAIDMRLQLN
ncbi:MAG: DUF6075 family protein [Enterococcus casseliflavus]